MMVFGVSPFTNPADPPALLRGSALQKEPREARRSVGRLVRATGQDQNKKGPEQRQAEPAPLCGDRIAAKCNRAQRANYFGAPTPWGWKGSSIGDGWGVRAALASIGVSRPGFSQYRRSGGVGGKDACELAH